MTATAFTGPLIACKDNTYAQPSTPAPVGQPSGTNPDEGPSMFHMAIALLDPRWQYTYEGAAQNPLGFNAAGVAINTAPTLGWLNACFQVADYAPGTASTTSLLPTGTGNTASTIIALTTSNTANITTASTVTNALNGSLVTGLWLIDNVPGAVTFGTGTYGVWDPANPPIGRCLNITSNNNASAVTFTISGYDAYGYPITQVLQGPNNATVTTGKAFKWVSGVTTGATSSATFSIGVSDVYGFPLYASSIAYLDVYWASTFHGASTGSVTFTAGSAAILNTSSDVRGTLAVSGITISNGARKMQMWQSVAPANLTLTGGLFGTFPPA